MLYRLSLIGLLITRFSCASLQSPVNAWKTSPIMLGNEGNLAYIPALLASGGTYDESMLLLRIDMLEEIEAGIDALNYALFRLNNEMNQVRISTTPPERSIPISNFSDLHIHPLAIAIP